MAVTRKKAPKKNSEKKLTKLPLWTLSSNGTEISRIFSFPTFVAGFSFVARIVVHAEVMGHHPEIVLSYGKVKVTLTTHDAKGLTKADFELAEKIDMLKV